MSKLTVDKKARRPVARAMLSERRIAAGEFKAKCLRVMDEVKATGQPVVVTKRGQPIIAIVSLDQFEQKKPDDFFGRLDGVIEIVGEPDDLIRPAFEPEEYDMLK